MIPNVFRYTALTDRSKRKVKLCANRLLPFKFKNHFEGLVSGLNSPSMEGYIPYSRVYDKG